MDGFGAADLAEIVDALRRWVSAAGQPDAALPERTPEGAPEGAGDAGGRGP